MRWNYLGFIGFMLVLFALGVGMQADGKTTSADQTLVYDRVIISDQAIPYEGPSIISERTPLPLKFWTLGHWLEDSENGDMEHILLTDGTKCWVRKLHIKPVYRITAPGGANIVQAQKKIKGDVSKSISIVGHLKYGTLVGVEKNGQALMATYPVITEDRMSGFVKMDEMTPVGNPGD